MFVTIRDLLFDLFGLLYLLWYCDVIKRDGEFSILFGLVLEKWGGKLGWLV